MGSSRNNIASNIARKCEQPPLTAKHGGSKKRWQGAAACHVPLTLPFFPSRVAPSKRNVGGDDIPVVPTTIANARSGHGK